MKIAEAYTWLSVICIPVAMVLSACKSERPQIDPKVQLEGEIQVCKSNGLEPVLKINVYDRSAYVKYCVPPRTTVVIEE